jgi:hypothetical protein
MPCSLFSNPPPVQVPKVIKDVPMSQLGLVQKFVTKSIMASAPGLRNRLKPSRCLRAWASSSTNKVLVKPWHVQFFSAFPLTANFWKMGEDDSCRALVLYAA